MAELPSELLFRRNWWWDPIDMEFFKGLKPQVQQEVLLIGLETHAQVLKTQAAGIEKIAGALKSGKQ